MPSDYPAFIFQDAIPAQQMMAHAQAVNEGQRIQELGKARQAEGMFRMAQLQQQQKAQKEKTDLDRMIAESQIQQAKIGNEFKNRELEQRGTLTEKGYDTNIKVAEIRAKEVDPRLAINEERQKYDAELQRKQDEREESLARNYEKQLNELDREIKSEVSTYEGAPEKVEGFLDRGGLSDYLAPKLNRVPSTSELKRVGKEVNQYRSGTSPATNRKLQELTTTRTSLLKNLRETRGWDYVNGKIIRPSISTTAQPVASSIAATPPPAYQLQPPAPADPRIDAIKREIAKFIQDGGSPAVAYERAAQLGVDLR